MPDDRRKSKRVCHVNLLKQYHERDARLLPAVLSVLFSVDSNRNTDSNSDLFESKVLPPIENHLTDPQNSEFNQLLTEFDDNFSDQPGNTHLVQHHIKLTAGASSSRSAPYWLSPDKMENRNCHFEGARNS